MRKILLTLALVLPVPVLAATASLTWTLPTQRADGSSLSSGQIQGFEVDYALCAAGNVFPATALGTVAFTGAVTSGNVTVPTYGTWCFRARTVDTSGQESANSGTVFRTYLAPPNPPGSFAVVNIVAYEFIPASGRKLAKLGKRVGTVPLGTACGEVALIGSYHSVPRSAVTLTRNTSRTIVAQCAASA